MTDEEDPGVASTGAEAKDQQPEFLANQEPRQQKYHPAADIFPLMEGDEFNDLVRDIKTHGLLQPIVRHHGLILDGRNRDRACAAAGVTPEFIDRDDITDPVAYVISANIKRRHLTNKQKRKLIVRLLQADPTKSDRQIAATMGVGHQLVGFVREEQEANRMIHPVAATTGADGRVRKRHKETHTEKVVKRAARRARTAEKRKKKAAEAGVGPDSKGEIERKLARLQELENEVRRLHGANIALTAENNELQAEVRRLKAALELVKGKPTTEGEDIPEFLRRRH
jgi:ParB-like chromosome segregation protein Spo0J